MKTRFTNRQEVEDFAERMIDHAHWFFAEGKISAAQRDDAISTIEQWVDAKLKNRMQ